MDDFPIKEVKPVDIEEVVDDTDDESYFVDEAAIPNVITEEANFNQFRE
jgi:hypothetical protein